MLFQNYYDYENLLSKIIYLFYFKKFMFNIYVVLCICPKTFIKIYGLFKNLKPNVYSILLCY